MKDIFRKHELFEIWFLLNECASNYYIKSTRVKNVLKSDNYKMKSFRLRDFAKRIEKLI